MQIIPHIAAVLVVTLAAGLLSAMPANAVPRWNPAKAREQRSVPGHASGYRSRPAATGGKPKPAPAVSWPKSGTAEVKVPTSGSTQAGGLPVRLGPPPGKKKSASAGDMASGDVRLRLLDQAAARRAGVDGLLLTMATAGTASQPATASPAPAGSARTEARAAVSGRRGRALMEVDYSKFRYAVGGDWASRLRLVRLPACALTSPERTECRTQTPLASTNDVAAGKVTAQVVVPAAQGTSGESGVVALAAGASGSAGSFAATPLAPSSTWQVSAQTGNFSWSYPLRMPPSLGGPVPQIGLGYSSSAVDGQTASTNNQPSWIGTGFDYWPGYIERRYRSCGDDSGLSPKKQDLCWRYDNATMSLNGNSTELIRDDATGVWKPKDDDGSKVEKLTGAANGDDGDTADKGEHWRITTLDGTQYYFGLNHLPGWSSGKAETGSTWTVPVFGNDDKEPCHKTGTDAADTFDKSWCQQAWRWNLDYVVDPHGNTMTYWYTPETNYYGRNLKSTGVQYTRGGTLTRIDYGQRKDALFTSKAPSQVTFTTAERCFPTGSITCSDAQFTTANAKYWPDVPVDQNCKSGDSCANKNSPTFWSRKRLTGVTTQIWNGTKYDPVDTWTLRQEMKDPGDGTSAGLWLDGITHAGKVNGDAALPEVTFEGTKLSNRVDPLQGPQMIKFRISSITSESGGVTSVNYMPAECTQSNLPAAEDKNDKRCFPLYWTPEGATSQKLEYFQKYPVASVVNDPRISGTPPVVTAYTYVGAPAWHHDDDDGLVEEKYKTWSQWRGYARVKVTTGRDGDIQSQSETLFYRGMDGDEQKDSNGKPTGRRDASVTDSEGRSVPDADVLEGQVREEVVYDKPGGQIQSATQNTPWVSGATAKRAKSWGTATAAMVRPGTTAVRTLLGDGTWRRTQAVTRYDDHGLGVEAEDDGDLSTSGDDTCTRTTYARNESAGMFNYVSRTLTASVACPAQDAGLPDDKIISGVQNLFDGKDFGAAPSAGNVTETRRLTGFTDGSPDWQTDTKTDYDDYGRVTASYEGGKADHKTTTTYHQVTSGGLVDQTVVTNALGHTETTTYQPAWAARTSVQDANGRTTLQQYDPLGRLTKVWLPGRTSSMSPHMQFTYTISKDEPAVVSTQQLMWDGSTYSTSYQLFDGLLRPVQTQAPAKVDAGGTVTGRMISDAFYDSSGRVFKTNDPYYNETAPSGTLYAPTDNAVPGQTVTTYDGQGRPTVEAFQKLGVEQWHTTTTYTGDSVSVVPPKGSTPTTKIVDAQGRTTELRQYHGATIGGDYDTTRYGYDSAGRLASVTDPAGNVWRTHYDLLGRKTKAEDPDKGTTTYTYTDLDQVESTEDARGKKLYFDYDLLGRQTAEHADSADGPKLAEWIYDKMGSTNVFGQAVSSIRYADGDPDKAYRTDVTGYDAAYRPTGTRVTIPNADGNGALAGTYETSMTYNADGSMATMTLPAAGGLPKETLRLGYDDLGRPQTLKGASTYVADTGYDGIGNLSTQLMATTTGAKVQRTYTYEDGTNRLKNVVTDRQKASPLRVENTTYDYYDSGDVKSIADQPGNGQSAENQCFTYDYLQRLNDAWTAKDACAAAPSATTVDTMGPAPYWQSYQYDLTGNRTKRTDHDLDGDTSRDVTKTYAYPAAGAKQPHALQSVTTVTPPIPGGSPGGTSVDTFKYDDTGNTTLQTVGGDDQKFDWDAEGHLTASTKGGQTTSFLYDADGDRLIRREPGATTLYLGTMELRLEGSSVTGTRYYTLGDDTVAVRTANGVQFLADDQHGTATRAIDATTNQVTKRYYDPFGAQRGTQPTNWPGERGFLGGTKDDSVGTTHLGAREYDAEDGRFLSVDPVIDSSDPQQMNAYSYGENNPATLSDPDGTRPDICMGGGDPKACNAWGAGQFHRMYPDWKPPHGTPYGDIYYHEGAYSQAAAAARQRAAQVAALKRLWAAQQKKIQLKRKLANALGSLLKIAADELGITAGIDCFAKGDIGACGETALNVLSSFAGGLLGKFATKYAAPWKWAKAAKLIGSVSKLVGTVVSAIKDLVKVGNEVGSAERALKSLGRGSSLFGKRFGRRQPEPPAANGTVGDLRGIPHDFVDDAGNWVPDKLKRGLARSLDDDDLLKSVFTPDDGVHMTYHDGHMMEGSHRMAELLRRAGDPNSSITHDTPIYVDGW
ncbi:type IV secretion protein Rhs [Actinoallomurus spadix]|uniref:RHS repeat-associated core domain-containing protein n=1 Tax=Actinoallomurus spadix TaxID=79912 RepID=A0ABN0VV38_9ACTN|nr:RHS repeat-associated core domain-containing protein [Actinoallomurus spadix]MCO5985777.1 type IV secretion protein Rhs [Actinoallomurus spadix]